MQEYPFTLNFIMTNCIQLKPAAFVLLTKQAAVVVEF